MKTRLMTPTLEPVAPWHRWTLRSLALVLVCGSAPLATAQEMMDAGVFQPVSLNTQTRPTVSEDVRSKLTALVTALRPEAMKLGVSKDILDRVFTGIEPDSEIADLLDNQPEHVATPWGYMGRLVSDLRIENGRKQLAAHAPILAAIEQRYGVDRHVVVAVWGIESSFGTSPGTRSVIRSLATLAVSDPRRPQFWRTELLTTLTILQRGDIAPERMTGSWAGAMGHTQFMPTSYMAHAADFDGDGRRDIWNSAPDALASTANYLKASGWNAGESWGLEVVLPAGFNLDVTAPGVMKSAAEWQQLGLTAPAGREWPSLGPSSLSLPAGVRGPAFLVGQNFRAILKYNNATAYALAVGHLADRLAGRPAIASSWPIDDPPLAKPERVELQRRLMAMGYDLGGADGVMGSATRAAVRAWQKKRGLDADGWAGERLLEHVRKASSP